MHTTQPTGRDGRKDSSRVNKNFLVHGSHAIVFNKDKTSVLLVKRRDVPVWVFPGGRIEPNETPEVAAVRETREESGYQVKIDRLIGQYSKAGGNTAFVYECSITGGKPMTSSESSGVEFFPLNNLPKLISPAVTIWLKDALSNHKSPILRRFPGISTKVLIKNVFTHPGIVLRYLLLKIFGIHINT